MRSGLKTAVKEKNRAKFKVVPHSFGFKPGVDLNRLNQLADELEAEEYVRKMTRQNNGPAKIAK